VVCGAVNCKGNIASAFGGWRMGKKKSNVRKTSVGTKSGMRYHENIKGK